jgi:hypothetical protein
MGDIIWGTFLIVLILGVFGLYRFSTRKKVEQRSFTKFISLLLLLGGLIGFLTTGLNERLLHDHPYTYVLTLIFFVSQTIASILYYKGVKAGLPVLIFTLLLQIPIVRGINFSYNNQTLFSFKLEKYPGEFWDIEPGSYVHFMYFDFDYVVVENSNRNSGFGLNLIPLLTIAVFWRTQIVSGNASNLLTNDKDNHE